MSIFLGVTWCYYIIYILVGGIPTPLKNDGLRQLGLLLFPIYGKIKNVPNHQPVYIYTYKYISG